MDGWKTLYAELIEKMAKELSDDVKKEAVFEVIFMTYSFVHHAINTEAFPNAIDLYHQDLMTVRGRRNVHVQA